MFAQAGERLDDALPLSALQVPLAAGDGHGLLAPGVAVLHHHGVVQVELVRVS